VLSNKPYVIIFNLPLRERSAALLQNFNSFGKVVGVDTDNFVKVIGVDTDNFVKSEINFVAICRVEEL